MAVRKLKTGGRTPDSFEVIYDQFADQVYNFLAGLLKDSYDAEEVMQEVFIRLWENRHVLRQDESVGPYLFKIARNQALNRIRARIRQHNLIETYILQSDTTENSPEVKFISEEFKAVLIKAVESLPEKRKQIYKLCKEEGKSYLEIASLLQLSTGTVENQMVKAFKHIRKVIQLYSICFVFLVVYVGAEILC